MWSTVCDPGEKFLVKFCLGGRVCVYSVSLCRPQGISLMPQLRHGFAPYNALWRQSLALTPPSASNDCWHTTHSLTALKITFWPKMKCHSLVKCIILRKGDTHSDVYAVIAYVLYGYVMWQNSPLWIPAPGRWNVQPPLGRWRPQSCSHWAGFEGSPDVPCNRPLWRQIPGAASLRLSHQPRRLYAGWCTPDQTPGNEWQREKNRCSSKILRLCSTEERNPHSFETTREWINDDRFLGELSL